MDNIAGTKSSLTWAVHISVVALVLLWPSASRLRAGLWGEDERNCLYPYGWAASDRVRRLCRSELDLDLGEAGDMDQTREIYGIVKDHLGPDDAGFFGDLDLPMQIISDGRHEQQLLMISARHGFLGSDYGVLDDDLMVTNYDEA